ncbi:MAG: glycosyltransferase family 87 protein [Stellaceae bacterium]
MAASGASLLALTILGLVFQSQDNIARFLAVAALQAGVYGIAVWLGWSGGSPRRVVFGIVAVAALMRVPVVYAPPYLSADAYRYVWDGRVEAAGINPYRYAPADRQLEALRDSDIFPRIASKYAPTIYPPAAEGIFLIVTRFGESVTVMKAAMVAFEMVVIILLARLLAAGGLPASRILVYAWHPLPLWEFAGSGHIDAALIALSVAALWAARRGHGPASGLFLAGATLTKLYPAVLLPALYRRWGWKMPAAFVIAIGVAYLPFIAAGSRVLGFLPGYAVENGFDGGGAGFYLLAVLHHLPPLARLSARAYVVGVLAILAALGGGILLVRDPGSSPVVPAAVLATAFMVLVSPHYAWYFAWLIVFACFIRSFALLWLTNACLLLYLIPGGIIIAGNDRQFAVESIIYGPFAALALLDLWYYRRRATGSS